VIRVLQRAGSIVVITVTSPGEAAVAAGAGADALCVQGFEAGAHRGTFTNDDTPGRDYGLLSLIGEVAAVTGLPQIAAGGIMSPRQVRAVLAAGGVAAQCGTAFLRCPESGAHPSYKAALADPHCLPGKATGRRPGGPPARSSSGCVRDSRERRRPSSPRGIRGSGPRLSGTWESGGTPMKAVRFDQYGGVEVLRVAEVPRPAPGTSQVLVHVKAAGINPGEAKVREGLLHTRWPATFPSGQGSDLARTVAATGPEVTRFSAGDEVHGLRRGAGGRPEQG
jgi:Nitronate monooxygenase